MEGTDYSRPELSHVWGTSELLRRVDAQRASCSLAFMKNTWNWFGPSHEGGAEEGSWEDATDARGSSSTLSWFTSRPAAPECWQIRTWNRNRFTRLDALSAFIEPCRPFPNTDAVQWASLNLESGRAGKLQLHRRGSVEVHRADLLFFFFSFGRRVKRRMVI